MSDEKVVVVGQTQENAQKLLDAAEALDYDVAVVRTVDDGFEAPSDVVDKAFGKSKASTDEGDDELSFSSKAEAETYADEHQLDVDKSLNAADYKAAVAAAAKGGE